MWTLFLLYVCLCVAPVDAHQGRRVDSKQIFFVKKYAASSWEDIASHLGIPYDTIVVFEKKHKDPRDSCWDMLHEWAKHKKSAATEEELYRALVAAERRDIAERLQDNRKADNEEEDSYLPEWSAVQSFGCDTAAMAAHVEYFRESLTHHYSLLHVLKPLPWDPRFTLELDEIFTELELVTVQGLEMRMPLRSMHDVFEQHVCPGPHILVKGVAGSGKSTLLSKLAFDWSKGRGKLADMKKYVLLIRLREVEPGESIAEIVWDQCVTKSTKGLSIGLIERYLREHESKLVFLLDGYDELPHGVKSIPELLAGTWYPNSTVLVTSRPSSGIEVERKMAVNCSVMIVGFSPDHVEQYMTKYFKAVGNPGLAPSLVQAVQADIVAKSLMQTPMFVMLICVLWEEDPTRVFPGTMSGLYHELLICLVRKYCKREDIAMLGDEMPADISYALLLLGEHAFKSLKRDQALIDLDETTTLLKRDTDILLKLGIVSKEVSASRLHPREQLNFPHKTMQEFLASRYIAQNLSSSSSYFSFFSSANIEDFVSLQSIGSLLHNEGLLQFICGSGDPASRMVLEKVNLLIPRMTFSQHSNPFEFAEKLNSDELCLVCLHESQDPSLVPILKGTLSFKDASLTIRVPSRQGAALMFYLAHAEGMPLSKVLNLTLEETGQGEAMKHLCKLVKSPLPDLQRLDVKCQIGNNLEYLTPLLRNVPSLRFLNLANTGLTEMSMDALRQALTHVPLLEELDLSWNKNIGDNGIIRLSEGFGSTLNLKRLDLSHNKISDAGCQLLVSILHGLNLEELKLNHNNIGNAKLETFAAMQNPIPSLKELWLYDNLITDISLQSLVTNLHLVPNLQILMIGFNMMTKEGIVNFAQTIDRIAALEELTFIPWETVYLDNTEVMSITAMLGRLPALRVFGLYNTGMEAAGFKAFMEAAEEHPTLKEIQYSEGLVPKGEETGYSLLTLMPPLPADQRHVIKNIREDDNSSDGYKHIFDNPSPYLFQSPNTTV
ncbi:nucleotide-binding oligomerization domain-containing protein 2-like [Branchiostoma floridae]|uniref:Nucleotide-binding oligomerization domain-containing protein 2-like n=1 Tax=Branchiostoma floridae TaxID=7739 RepID=A0A9J7MYW0_BRAFL|nr:nucleotide-binding oligomerization domain-containing protein 2-like [Branchiostoma floridae]